MSIDIQGFKFEDSPAARWTLEPVDLKYTTLGKLLRKFYREYKWDKKPLGWARNPINKNTGDPYFDPNTNPNVIVAPFRKGFYIVIFEAFRNMFGPHVVRLMYRSNQLDGDDVWVAICQINAMWHGDDRMLAALQEAISTKEFFQSIKSYEQIVIE